MEPSSCPLCCATTVNPVGHKQVRETTYPLARCAQCCLVFVTGIPSPEALASHYAQEWAEAQHPSQAERRTVDQGIEAMRFRRRLKELSHWAAPPGRLLDVGCKDGAFLALAQARGWRVHGVELSHAAAAAAQARGVEVFVGTLEETPYAQGTFDVITLWHIIEHVPQPLELLRTVHRLLQPHGLIALETPNIGGRGFHRHGLEWEYLTPPAHLRYFGPRSLGYALGQAGFEVLKTRCEGGTGLGPRLTAVGLHGVRQWALDHYQWVWPLKRAYLALFGWLAPSDDIVIVYARKKA